MLCQLSIPELNCAGDKRGARSFVYEICHPGAPQDARNSLLSKASNVSRNAHETEYMQQMGVYSMPPDDVCDDLIRCYFQHVHFFLPIVDAPGFLNEYFSNGYQDISLLLFWAMLLAGANVSCSPVTPNNVSLIRFCSLPRAVSYKRLASHQEKL